MYIEAVCSGALQVTPKYTKLLGGWKMRTNGFQKTGVDHTEVMNNAQGITLESAHAA